jgi:peptidoglycan/xylan/chitin deacetylase (PgdA/CDA1 family)
MFPGGVRGREDHEEAPVAWIRHRRACDLCRGLDPRFREMVQPGDIRLLCLGDLQPFRRYQGRQYQTLQGGILSRFYCSEPQNHWQFAKGLLPGDAGNDHVMDLAASRLWSRTMSNPPRWAWPGGKRIAVVFNVCLEAWSDGKAPGISPMGNPLPSGVLDTMAISWAAYGVDIGIHRLMDGLQRHGAKASVMVNAIIAERSPETVRTIADRGHEVLSHSYAMDVIPALLSDEDERKNIARCTKLLAEACGKPVCGWLSPRGTSKPTTPGLLAEAGYRWYGDVFNVDLPYVASHGNKKIVAIPLSYDVNDMPSMKYGHPPRMMLESYNEVIEIARARSDELRIIDITSHAHIFGHHRGAHFYEKIIEQAMASPDIWVGTRAEIADHVLSMASN